jgi:membrane associated rhomboid family serine protease
VSSCNASARFEQELAKGASVVIPVYDENNRDRGAHPWMMWAILSVNVLVLIYLWLLPAEILQVLAFNFGIVPAFISKAISTADLNLLMPPLLTLGTYSFLHGNWIHLAGNMIFLWVFGDNIEAALGHFRFLVFYLLCGAAGALAHVISEPGSVVPLIGASGAVAGIVAAYVLLHPWAHVTVLLFGLMTARVHAYWLLGAWIAWQVLNIVWFASGWVSYWSHVGGLVAGAGLVVVLRRPGVTLFQGHIAHRSRGHRM